MHAVRALWLFVALTACGSGPGSEEGDAGAPDATITAPACAAGETIACTSLGHIWSGGTATCRPAGTGFDTQACTRGGDAASRVKEIVYPALRDTRWQDARCSHEGAFAFEISMPPDPDGTWVIHLQGGGFCGIDGSDDGGCSQRERGLVSSANLPADGTVGVDTSGAAGDVFARSIQVLAHYCSNDLWTGSTVDGGPMIHYTDGTYEPWTFTGHLNVSAMLDVLVERYGLDDAAPELAIFASGSSAGGWGAFNNALSYKQRFPITAGKGNLLINPNAGFVPVSGSNVTGLAVMTQMWTSVIAPACAAEHADNTSACITGPVMYDYLTAAEPAGADLPVLVYQNRQDQLYMKLAAIGPLSDASSPDELAAREAWVTRMNAAMGLDPAVPNASTRIPWLYAPSDPVRLRANGTQEPNVHPPGCYDEGPPDGADQGMRAVTARFWSQRGKGPGRGRAAGEVHTYDVNWVTTGTCP